MRFQFNPHRQSSSPWGLLLFTSALCASSAQCATRGEGAVMTIAVLKVCSSGSLDLFSGRVRWVSKANEP